MHGILQVNEAGVGGYIFLEKNPPLFKNHFSPPPELRFVCTGWQKNELRKLNVFLVGEVGNGVLFLKLYKMKF